MEQWLGSKYVLHEVLGRGAMGQVFAASIRESGAPVAAKVLKPELVSDPEVAARFFQERSILTSIRHPNVVRVIDLVVEGETLGIVMELIQGQDLRRRLLARRTLPPAEAVRLTGQLLRGAAAVHAAGIVHRDIKPENVLLDTSGGQDNLKLTDFGVARLSYGASLTRLTSLIGTPEYMSPELAEQEKATPAADLYSAGIVLYEMLCGRTPFAGGLPVAVLRRHIDQAPPYIPGLPPGLWEQVAWLLAKDPRARPGSAGEAADALGQLEASLAGVPALPAVETSAPESTTSSGITTVTGKSSRLASPQPPAPGTQRSGLRSRPLIAALTASLLILGAAAGVLLVRLDHHRDPRNPAATTVSARSRLTRWAQELRSLQASLPPTRPVPKPVRSVTPSPAPTLPAVTTPISTPSPAAPVRLAPAQLTYASSPLTVDSSSIRARVYFGQLHSIIAALAGQVVFNTSESFQEQYSSLCVSTVVFSNVAGGGAVYAQGLGTGWTGAENAPSQAVQGSGHNLHQQLIVPPTGASAGDMWRGTAELSSAAVLTSGSYALRLVSESGSSEAWQVNGGEQVGCSS